ncbi:hypothetical protein EMIHUDRAFT_121579 [Emiliania huxleyi CCMP1516]|uniref:Uncharacterized protein n=2 Tax=Emiliania huxleyi TaxID=2903 RepID=A0A0D3I042_EMIH1|nr:hypothetical protein EMIHUDRAFT_121579 [Emiliania huxleyi CCMP1516]EOD04627.1 hypothetical protein EMIHUDRAFT_121579 [Emiliania huxleyi CCMP1516]|eukprot:XP_005757056.1 hypothetical protein EMIHUDRAFT_121579 [Emiliania huxleyi CCMP1516]
MSAKAGSGVSVMRSDLDASTSTENGKLVSTRLVGSIGCLSSCAGCLSNRFCSVLLCPVLALSHCREAAAQKLTRKQKLRKAKKQERGAANADRREIKAEHDAHKAERRLRAKALW